MEACVAHSQLLTTANATMIHFDGETSLTPTLPPLAPGEKKKSDLQAVLTFNIIQISCYLTKVIKVPHITAGSQ